MSEPVTNVEIEDVLSSIRRLVADRDHAPPDTVAREALAAAPDRLILTPALRVEPLRLEPAPVDDLPVDDPPADDLPVGAVASAPRARGVAADEAAGVVARLAARIEAAIKSQAEDFEPDGSEDVPVMDWAAPAPEDAPVFRSRAAAPLRLKPAEAVDLPVFQHRGRDAIEAIAEAQGAERGRSVGDSANSPAEDATDDGLDPALAALFGPETLVNEDMLRSLIVDVVRQELQGALGERITRNVRKLVRREIYRVIASQELE